MNIDLNGNDWRVKQCGSSRVVSASVPGCIHKDLLRAGLIPDPQFRDQEKQVQWVGETGWMYERDFAVPAALLDHDPIELVCDGLDTLATIRINGAEVARTDNMHRRYRFDIAHLLQVGTNRIAIDFAAPLIAVRERQAVRAMPHWPQEGITPGFSWLRKAQCNFGWDFGQKLATCGIWRPLRIAAWNQARLGDLRVDQRHAGGVAVSITPEIVGEGPVTCRAILCLEGWEVAAGERCGTETGPILLRVENPRLWWPAGMGDQPLYSLRVELLGANQTLLDSRQIRIGLRTLRLQRAADEWGESFAFAVNGQRFFAKGANWIPTDSYASRRDPAYYRAVLQSAVAAHMNMLRVWGGGIYEEDLFYELCDELGLCVWQDFMFACAGYPLDDPDFLETVRLEAVDNVRRLQHHACLALWCGNNELELGWHKDWGLIGDGWQYGPFGKMPVALYAKVFDGLLPEIVQSNGGQDYWPGTPHSPTGDRKQSNHPTCGDAHIWDVLMSGNPFSFYTTCDHRFVSEFGFQSLPSPGLLDRVTEAGDRNLSSRIMDWHQRMPAGNGMILLQLARHLPLPGTFEMSVWATQILHAILLETAIGHWRRNTPRTLGVLNWMLNDHWPSMSNATLDSTGAWKAAHYALQRVFAPLLVSGVVTAGRDHMDLHISSDRSVPGDVVLTWTVMRTDGTELASDSLPATIAPLSSRPVHRLAVADFRRREGDENLLVWLELTEAGRCVSESVITLVPPKHLNLFDPQLKVEPSLSADGGRVCRLSVERPALWVWAGAPIGQSWSDNFFPLRPGVATEVRLPVATEAVWLSLKDLGGGD